MTPFCNTKELADSVRLGAESALFEKRDILELCSRAEELLSISGRLERALHEAIKTIELHEQKG